jgi:hypothetical protein
LSLIGLSRNTQIIDWLEAALTEFVQGSRIKIAELAANPFRPALGADLSDQDCPGEYIDRIAAS